METTPRILSPHLSSFTSRTVRLLGKITALHGDTATLDSGGEVTLRLNRDSHFEVGKFFEVVGKVMEGLDVRVMVGDEWVGKGGIGTWRTGLKRWEGLWLGDEAAHLDADMKAYEAVVDATHRYKEIFYED